MIHSALYGLENIALKYDGLLGRVNQKLLCFLKAGLSQKLSSLQSDQMEPDAQGTWRLPLGASQPSPPHPSSPLNWGSGWAKGPVFRLSPAGVGHFLCEPPTRLPCPSCSGQCPNASTSHLGLAKPVPTAGGEGVTRTAESTHPWQEHNGTRTGWLTGLGTDNTVNRAEWQTASQNNDKPAEQWLENVFHHYYTHTQTHALRHTPKLSQMCTTCTRMCTYNIT